ACYHFYNGVAWKNLCQKGIDTAVINKAIKNYLGGVTFTTVINNMLVDSSVTNYAVINNAIVNNITIDSSVINYTTINNATINNLTVDSSSINFTTINNAVVNNITIDSSVINYTTINNAVINNLTVDSSYTNVSNSNISNINIANIDTSITNVATINNATINNLTSDSTISNYSNINNAVIDSSVTNYSQVSHLQGGWGSMDSLQIGGQNIMTTLSDSIKSQAWLLKGNTGTNAAVNFLGTADNTSLRIRTNNIERMIVDNIGNVGIGTTAPTEKLEVTGKTLLTNGFSATNAALVYKNNTDYMYLGPQSGTSVNGGYISLFGSTNTEAMAPNPSGIDMGVIGSSPALRIINNGMVGIGTATPTRTLDVNGDVQLSGNLFFGNGNVRTQTRLDAGLATSAGAQSGFYDNDGVSVVNYPPSAPTWWHLIESRHANPLNNMALQIAGGHYDQDLWFRKINNNPAQPWSKLLAITDTNNSLGWLTNGNSGTNSATNFIGTTDAQSFIIKTNNIKRITVDSTFTEILRNLSVSDINKTGNTAFFSSSYTYHPLATLPDYVRHNQILSTKRVASGLTDNGYSVGMWVQNYRGLNDNIVSSSINDDDGGTLSTLAGISLQYGHHNYGQTFPNMASAVTTEATGISIDGAGLYGTITNAYDIRTGTSVASTNHYALYADGSSKKSYFAGSVGIGTTTPAQKLTIEGGNIQLGEALPATGEGRKLIFSNGFNNSDSIYFKRENVGSNLSKLTLVLGDDYGATVANDQFNIQATNNVTPVLSVNTGNVSVGIGTGAPASTLDIFPNTSAGYTRIGSTLDYAYNGGADNIYWFKHEGAITGRTSFLNSSSVEMVSIVNNGNVGVGTPSPAQKLTIENGDVQIGEAMAATAVGRRLMFTDIGNSSDAMFFQRENILSDASNLNLYIGDNQGSGPTVSDKFNVMTVGNPTPIFTVDAGTYSVGIGNTNPQATLDLRGPVKYAFASGTGAGSDGPSRAIIPAGDGGSYMNDWPNAWGGGLSTWDIVGSSTFFGAYNTRSDIRLKKDIVTMNTDITTNFMQLRPVTYLLKKETPELNGTQYGFIAQEVAKLFPSIVTKDSGIEGATIGMNYQALIAPTVHVVQEQQKTITTLQTQLQELSNKLDAQNKLLQQLMQERK
ncbi:MAG: tail fiber domain-containing protein, partial [Bacteroidia bacterium]